MAYNENSTITTLAEVLVNKRGSESIRVNKYVNNENGEVSYDIRRWYLNDNDEFAPTQKGVRVKREFIQDILNAITADLEEDGVINPDIPSDETVQS